MTRKGSAGDVPFMRSMLAHAYAWRVNAFEADIPLSRYVDSAEIDTLEAGGAHAARAELTLSPDAPDGFVFAALDRGSVLTYLGAPAPIP